ncbi:unnamed protein product [Allacma fusca]|uniref:Uncharacterized protein n=1 Tax=Allacma fusca TaxID=39272 RepID=A0A8J2KRL2_9HEXA|nr:unnamed protein product [Allacma fusca]
MAPEDKFQYLIQSMREGSKAREVVNSFPLSNSSDVISISSLYDKLETQLPALESLGVTQYKYAAMFYPLVESCLPEEVLRTLERNRRIDANNEDRLEGIMKFLKSKVRDWRLNQDDLASSSTNSDVSVLGLSLCTVGNTLTVAVENIVCVGTKVTKRMISSCAHRVFDRIGFTYPVHVVPKVLLQKSWSLKLGCDDELPEKITKEFHRWSEQVTELKKIKIPRWLVVNADQFSINLVIAKTRVAPKKQDALPRLELCGALLVVKLLDTVKGHLRHPIEETHLWTDSTIDLSWIADPSNWKTFVSNRISTIVKSYPRCS